MKKTKKTTQKSTEWNLGQPLAFPKKKDPTTEVVEVAMGEPLVRKTKRPKKRR